MKKNVKFNIGLEVFPLFVREKINYLRRDMEEFAKYGYTVEQADALDARVNSFEAFPTDPEFEGDVMISTENKNAMSHELLQKIRSVMMRVQDRYGKQSAYYKKFEASALSNVSDDKLVNTARRVARVATMYLTELQEKGLTQVHIDELATMADDFAELKELQKDAVADREIGTTLRVNTVNALYVEISKLCEIGKGIWKETNEAKYNDYIIYDTPSAKPEEKVSTGEEESNPDPL